MNFSIEQITTLLDAKQIGKTSVQFTGLNHLEKATEKQVSFIGTSKHAKLYNSSNAGAIVISENLQHLVSGDKPLLVVSNADLAMAKLLALFEPEAPYIEADIHPLATVHHSAQIGKDVSIGAGCYIGANVIIEDEVVI